MENGKPHEAFYQEYEVFSRKKENGALEYRFSLLAPNKEMAFLMAKENFYRREPVYDLWVVKRDEIRKMTQNERENYKRLDKQYRETKGYADLNARWRAFKQAAGEYQAPGKEKSSS